MYKYILVILTIITQFIHAQDTPWSRINTGNSALPNETVKCIVFDSEGAMWVGTYMGGLAVNKDSVWTVYNTSNSELPHNYINSIAIDKNDVKWIGTDGGGLARFDGTTWQVFKTSNSGLPSNVVMSVYSDKNGILWVGTYFGGLARFDGQNWTIFNDENSPLLSNKVVALAIDTNNLVWVGTQGGGLGSYDGNNWTIYTERSSKLTSDYIYSIAIDGENNKWVGTGGGGVAVFNDAYWLNFNSKNSKIGDDNIRPILVDDQGDKWIGTYIGGVNMFDGEEWKVFNYQNSSMPDDEVTCLAYKSPNLFLGTERSGIVSFQVTQKPKDTDLEEDITNVVTPAVVFDDKTYEAQPEEQVNPVEEQSKIFTAKTRNKIVLLFDAADVYFDKARLTMYRRSFKLLLKNRERINDTYDVTLMIYSSNYDLNPKKIQFTEGDLKALRVKNVIYLEGETQFTEAVKKAFNNVSDEYNSIGDNHVIAATYKFINDDETAKIVIKENSDKYNIVFSLLAYETSAWKMEYKMKDLVPRGNNYYSINHASIKDNWSVTGQIGLSIFRGDLDVNSVVTFPGVFGFAVNKQVLSTGIINGGIKGQFNFGKLQGSKNGYSFENKYKEGCLNFQVILNTWVNRNFRFEKVRPYAFAGIGFINYRVLLRDPNGNVENGYGYKVTQGDVEGNGQNPEKDQAVTDLMIPLGVGLNYKLNEKINLEIEASSRFINSDRLDGRVKYENDKYWFVSVGITYMFSNKEFLADILNR